MAKLKVPSLQHLARNYRNDSDGTKRLLVDLVSHPPAFSYKPLFDVIRDMLVFGMPYEQAAQGLKRIKRPTVRDNLLGALALVREYFTDASPDFVQDVARRYYPIGRGLMVPFDPPLIYGANGKIHFPWFSFWRENPLDGERLSLFVTIVKDVLLQDPDLENAKFSILDFSAPSSKSARELRIVDADDVPMIARARMLEMLGVFAEGYKLAEAELSTRAVAPKPEARRKPDGDQQDFFDV